MHVKRSIGMTLRDLRIAHMNIRRSHPKCEKEFKLYMDAMLKSGGDNERMPAFVDNIIDDAYNAAVSQLRTVSLLLSDPFAYLEISIQEALHQVSHQSLYSQQP